MLFPGGLRKGFKMDVFYLAQHGFNVVSTRTPQSPHYTWFQDSFRRVADMGALSMDAFGVAPGWPQRNFDSASALRAVNAAQTRVQHGRFPTWLQQGFNIAD